MFGTRQATAAAKHILSLRTHYTNPPKREREIDPLFYAYLHGLYSSNSLKISRQVRVQFTKKLRPSLIDYRIGGSNPTLLELAVRPPSGHSELMGPQNLKELRKLSKFPQTKAKRRILLLLDLKDKPIQKFNLKKSYDNIKPGRGWKYKNVITVVYVNSKTGYAFRWKM